MTPIQRPSFPRTAREIELVAVGAVESAVFEHLNLELPGRFGIGVRVDTPLALRPEWRDAARDQYQADLLLDALVARRSEGTWSLGIVDADLYVPGLTFIFGQATVGGCCAVIGLARLRGSFYSRPDVDDSFYRRILIEAVHELGHVAGLDHCPDPECVMHFSETIEDTDRKGPDFCSRCIP